MKWHFQDKACWHRWFAWRPVILDETSQWVWLEWIERRESNELAWNYRPTKAEGVVLE